MHITARPATSYSVTRFTVDVPGSFEDFRGQYEQAVPPEPREEVDTLVARGAPWSEMNDLIAGAAPLGSSSTGRTTCARSCAWRATMHRGSSTSWGTTRSPSACTDTTRPSCCTRRCTP
jgi:hypothetical protein